MLNEIGVEGQEKLKKAKVLVVGAGGLGCPALQYLTAAGVGSIGIVDGDVVDITNLQRQILYTIDDIGKSKAKCAAKKFAKTSARRNLKPRAIFAEILDFLKESNYELPEYSYLCDLVGQVIEFEQKRLAKIVRSVTKAKKKDFDQFWH